MINGVSRTQEIVEEFQIKLSVCQFVSLSVCESVILWNLEVLTHLENISSHPQNAKEKWFLPKSPSLTPILTVRLEM